MQKTLTKEELAEKLDGCEYRGGMPNEIIEAAKENNLVFIHGASDDLIEFRGALTEEIGITSVIPLNRGGVPESDCDNQLCPYFKQWLDRALKRGEVKQIKVFWGGECGTTEMDAAKYAELGKPTWCFETNMPHSTFRMFDTCGGDKEYFCRGIVIDLDEAFPSRNYTQIVMEQGGWET